MCGGVNILACANLYKRKFVAAKTGTNIKFCGGVFDSATHHIQKSVAEIMAENVVDLLKAVHIEEKHAKRIISVADKAAKLTLKRRAVFKVGQTVAHGNSLDLVFFVLQELVLRFERPHHFVVARGHFANLVVAAYIAPNIFALCAA